MICAPPLEPVRLQGSLCRSCGSVWYPARPRCNGCRERDLDGTLLPADGTIYSFTVVRVGRPGVPVPYGLCIADFGGIPVFGRLLEWENARIGERVLSVRAAVGAAEAREDSDLFGVDCWLVPAAVLDQEGDQL